MKITLSLTLALLFMQVSFSQDLDLNWSDSKDYSKKVDGRHLQFIGSNDDFIYSRSGSMYSKKSDKMVLSIICHDKETMNEVNTLQLSGHGDNKREALLDNKRYYKTVFIGNLIHVFWQETKGSVRKPTSQEIFVETYNTNFEEVDKLRSIKKIDREEIGNLDILSSKGSSLSKKKNGIIITNQVSQGKDEPFVEYVDHFDYQMSEISSEEYELEIIANTKTSYYSNFSSFSFEEDGNLYMNSTIKEEVEKTGIFKRGYKYFSQLTVINVQNNNIEFTDFKDDDKDIYSLTIVNKKDGNYLMGFFRDLEKDKSGSRTHGLFSAAIDVSTGELEENTYTYFSKSILDNLFQEDVDDRKKSRKLSKRKKEKEDELNKDAISYNYNIEKTQVGPNGELLLFCSAMHNYSVTSCTTDANGHTTCTTRYYCNKKNVTIFAMDPDGEILWSKNVDRNITYNGTSIYDIEVAEKEGKFFIIYGGNNAIDLEDLSKREQKKLNDRRDNFSYAVLDPTKESIEAKTFKIEQVSTKKRDQLYVDPKSITVIDNVFYTNSTVSKLKVGPTIAVCAGSFVCPLLIGFLVMPNEFAQKTTGQIGKIEPMD